MREEAEKLGISADEYLVELLSQGLDPKNKALEYIGGSDGVVGGGSQGAREW